MTAPTAPLPVITTQLLERRERGYLAWVAIANEVAELPLESAPIDASTHALEIQVEGFDQPLVVLAEPMGAPTSIGFPLRLRPLDPHQARQLRSELFAGEPHPHRISQVDVGKSRGAEAVVTEEHAMALAKATGSVTGGGPTTTARRAAPGSLRGRTLGDGRFVLDELIGGGGSGEVYRALHATLRRAVAVKILHPNLQRSQEYCTRFYVEALAASQLDHRNVLRVIDYGQEPDGMLYIVMELLEGRSLQRLLDSEGRLSERRIVELMGQACAGLAHAHDAGVIHRDIKPENIVIVKGRDDDGRETELVKVCDFGIAHWTERSQSREIGDDEPTLLTKPDASKVVGTPLYMAPEQIQNDVVDARTDVYALGVVLYELATGRVPFLAPESMEILRCHLVEAPDPPKRHVPELSAGLDRIILQALEKDPADRQRDVRQLRTELRGLLSDVGTTPFGSGMHRKISVRAVALAPNDFLTAPADSLATMRELVQKDRPAAYDALREALRTAIVEGHAQLALDFLAWLERRLSDRTLSDAERDLAQRAMNALRDPEIARAHVTNLIDRKVDPTDQAVALLRAAGPLAARALIDVRRVRSPSLELRSRFVSTLRAIGAPALSVIVSTLEPLIGLASRQEEALAEDLLRAIAEAPPAIQLEAGGDVTVRFVRLDRPSLGLTALRATVLLWGVRAQPLLVGVLDAPDDAFRLAAIEDLQRLGCVDDLVVDRLGRIVTGQYLAGDDLKVVAAAALASPTPEARVRATAFLVGRLSPATGLMGSIRSALGSRDETRVAVALARSLFVLDPVTARTILDRLVIARPELRPYVDVIRAGR